MNKVDIVILIPGYRVTSMNNLFVKLLSFF